MVVGVDNRGQVSRLTGRIPLSVCLVDAEANGPPVPSHVDPQPLNRSAARGGLVPARAEVRRQASDPVFPNSPLFRNTSSLGHY